MIDSTGAVYYYLNDHLGSAAVVINSSGTVRDKHRYQAFGGSDGSSVVLGQAYRYTGKPLDEELDLDWYYYGARYYDPSIGRFFSVDPLAYGFPTWSPYTYCYNDPLKHVDPDGQVGFLAAAGIGAGVGAGIGFSVEMLSQAYQGGGWYKPKNYDFSNIHWKACWVSAGEGAVLGLTAVFCGPTGAGFGRLGTIMVSGVMGTNTYMVGNYLKGEDITLKDALLSGGANAIAGPIGARYQKLFQTQQAAYWVSRVCAGGNRTVKVGVNWTLDVVSDFLADQTAASITTVGQSTTKVVSTSYSQTPQVLPPSHGQYPIYIVRMTDPPRGPNGELVWPVPSE